MPVGGGVCALCEVLGFRSAVNVRSLPLPPEFVLKSAGDLPGSLFFCSESLGSLERGLHAPLLCRRPDLGPRPQFRSCGDYRTWRWGGKGWGDRAL